ncbi:MAG TPA: hypothetical protein VIY47_04655, partial [Ignavibacteriaceae bacterium]
RVEDVLSIYFLTFLISIFFSFPALLVYYLIYYLLYKKKLNQFTSKVILILFTAFSIVITFIIIDRDNIKPFAFSYGIAAILAGLVFKLKHTEHQVDHDNLAPTES